MSLQRRFKGAGMRRLLRAPRAPSGMTIAEAWDAIVSKSYVVEVWDAERGLSFGTGISDWEGIKQSITTSQATGSKQPSSVTGLCPSGVKAVRFDSSAQQELTVNDATLNSTFEGDTSCVYSMFRLNATSINQNLWCSASKTTANMYMLGDIRSVADRWRPLFSDAIAGIEAIVPEPLSLTTDYWSYACMDVPGNSLHGKHRDGTLTTKTGSPVNLSTLGVFTQGSFQSTGSTTWYLDGDVYGYVVMNNSPTAEQHAELQGYVDIIMGLS